MDRGAWRATVHGVAKSQTRLKNQTMVVFQKPNNSSLSKDMLHRMESNRILYKSTLQKQSANNQLVYKTPRCGLKLQDLHYSPIHCIMHLIIVPFKF